MKVLFTSHWYPSEKNPSDGIFIKKHYDSIEKLDVEVDLLILRIKNGKKVFKLKINRVNENKTEVIVESIFWKFFYILYPLQKFFIWRSLLMLIRKNNYDLIHANVTHPNGVFASYLSQQLNIPFIITEHHSQIDKYANKIFTKKHFKRALKNASYITAVSSFLKQKIQTIISSQKIEVVGNVIDGSVFKYIEKQSIVGKNFISIANWNSGGSNTKLPYLMCKALHDFSLKIQEPIVLNHVGNCNIKKDLLKLQNNYLTINFLGKKSSFEINQLLNSSFCFLHTTKFETFCVVGVEAQKSGCPVIISNIDPINTILTHNSVLFADNNIHSWVEALHKINKKSVVRKTIANASKGKFESEEIARKFEIIYNYILKK